MSAVTTFTVRDLNRQPAKILDVVRKFGSAEIRTRGGEVFTIAPKAKKKAKRKMTPDEFSVKFKRLWKKQRDLGHIPPPASENERINRIIAGEE